MKNLLLFTSFLVLLCACASENKKSNTIKSNEIYQEYTLNLNSDNTFSKVEAEFRTGAYWDRMETEKTGGDAVELVSPASITFNGEPLQMDNSVFTGAYYKLGKEISNNGTFTWVWTDNDRKKYTNTAKMNPIKLKDFPDYISYNEDLVVTWDGGPVEENETVTVTIEGTINDKKDRSSNSAKTVGATSVSFSPELLKLYNDQNVDIEITRTANIPVSEGTKEGGVIKLSFNGNSVSTTITGTNSLVREVEKLIQ